MDNNKLKSLELKELKEIKNLEVKDLKKMKLELSPIIIKHIQLFLFPFITFIVVILLSWYFLLPQVTEIQTAADENRRNEEILSRLETKRSKLLEIKNSSIIADFDRLEEVLPSQKNIPILINTLQSVQRDQAVIYESLTIRPGVIDDETLASDPVSFNVNVGGPPEKVISYIGELLDTIPIVNINTISLTTDEGYTRAAISINSYFYPLPTTLGAIDAALPVLSKGAETSVQTALGFKDPPFLVDIPLEGTESGEVSGSSVSIFNL